MMEEKHKNLTKITALITFTVLFIIAIVFLIYKIRAIIPPILYGALIAFILLPVTEFLNKKMPRFLAAIFSIMMLLLILSLLGYILFPELIKQIKGIVIQIPMVISAVNTQIDKIISVVPGAQENPFVDNFLTNISSNLQSYLTTITQKATQLALGKISMIPSIFVSLILAFFFMKDSAQIFNISKNIFYKNKRAQWVNFLKECEKDVRDYYNVILLVAISTGVTMGIMSYFVGVPYYTMIGAMDAVLEIFPYLGPTIVFITGSLFAISVSLKTFILFAVFFFAIEITQSQIVIPHFAGKKISLPPLVIILVIIIGGAIGKVLGVIIAVPVFLIGRNILKHFYPDIYNNLIH